MVKIDYLEDNMRLECPNADEMVMKLWSNDDEMTAIVSGLSLRLRKNWELYWISSAGEFSQ